MKFTKLFSAFLIILTGCFGGSTQQSPQENRTTSDDETIVSDNPILVKRADGSAIKMKGYQPTAKNLCAAAPQFSSNVSSEKLPSKVDLRKYMTPVEQQGTIGSCTANSCAGAYEYLINRNEGHFYDISRLFLYYNSRCMNGQQNVDMGAPLGNVLKCLSETGVCSEELWPYITNKVFIKPPQNAYDEAKNRTISKYEYVPTDLNTWKSVLAEGYPIIFGANLFQAFQQPRNGRIPMPNQNEYSTGAHAMLCVGYSDPDQVFIVRNSWGHQWGDNGYCYFPYDYLMNPNLNNNDSWVIYSVTPISGNDAKDAWSNDNQSLFVDMNDEFTNMSDEDWEAMCNECGDYDIVFRLGALYNVAFGEELYGDNPEESRMAEEKLKRLFNMFGIRYSAKKVLENSEDMLIDDKNDDFMDKTLDIIEKYLSDGARATIAADMFEIANADGECSDDEKEFIDVYVGDWFNNDILDKYMSNLYDAEEEDVYNQYDNENFENLYGNITVEDNGNGYTFFASYYMENEKDINLHIAFSDLNGNYVKGAGINGDLYYIGQTVLKTFPASWQSSNYYLPYSDVRPYIQNGGTYKIVFFIMDSNTNKQLFNVTSDPITFWW